MKIFKVSPYILKAKIKLGYTLTTVEGAVEKEYRRSRVDASKYGIDENETVRLVSAIKAYSDKTRHVKIYEGFNLMLLNKAGITILQYIFSRPDLYEAYFITLSSNRIRIQLDCTEETVKRGIKNLVEADFICKARKDVYWINVDLFFKGRRWDVVNAEVKRQVELEGITHEETDPAI